MPKADRKVVVLGLDGVPYSLLVDYLARGMMPELAQCCEQGRLLRMHSTLPEISSVAWSSFMTGKNPGEHGVFGFVEIDPESYEYNFPNFTALRVRPFWERENLKTVAFNIPQTYPARPMNGVMVSGFVALDLKKSIYPQRVFQYLHQLDYKIDVNSKLATEDPEKFFEDLLNTFAKRKTAIEYLYDHEDWQLFIGTVTETDRLHHFFFNSAREGKYFQIFERFYAELDKFIGSLSRKAINDGAVFLTCSDHGFASIRSEIYINKWLRDYGYLQLDGRGGFTGMNSATKAFCLDPSRIYIHLENKYSRGRVKPSDYQDLISELKEKLDNITFGGNKIIRQIYSNNEIFRGELSISGPDLYLLPNYGFDLKGALDKTNVFGKTHFQGMHTYDDAHLFISRSVDLENENINIEDISKIILQYI
jgi:predicted AlkP superfamily phosphohydrolase/phosphomutase